MAVALDRTAPTRTTPTTHSLRGLALAALATVVWSGGFVTSRALHDSVPPVQQAFWRWVAALLAVAHVVAAVRKGAGEGAAVGRVLGVLREVAVELSDRARAATG
ncbi:hypothetical protein [Streptomyces guryensis]|uniref:hypothetical protein n=1 Tax=Streptomyces guryensis TaxID=2886947 RepID=UPI00355601C4